MQKKFGDFWIFFRETLDNPPFVWYIYMESQYSDSVTVRKEG